MVAIGETVRADTEVMWTIGRVPLLTDKLEEKFVAGYVGDGQTTAWLPRRAFAEFVVEELSKNEWIQKQPLVSS